MSVKLTNAGGQKIDWGSAVSSLTSYSISFWFQAVSNLIEINICYVGNGLLSEYGWAINFMSGASKKIEFITNWSTVNGFWNTTSNVITSTDVWYFITITYDGASTSNNPKIYINGSSVGVTKTATPSGSLYTTTATKTTIGSPSGYMADWRIYSGVLSAAQVLALYNAGPFTPSYDTNLVFHAPLTNATALSGSSFDGYTLTSSQKLIDRIGCAQGTPSGSPLGSNTNPT